MYITDFVIYMYICEQIYNIGLFTVSPVPSTTNWVISRSRPIDGITKDLFKDISVLIEVHLTVFWNCLWQKISQAPSGMCRRNKLIKG